MELHLVANVSKQTTNRRPKAVQNPDTPITSSSQHQFPLSYKPD
jgi:hypothetical protein